MSVCCIQPRAAAACGTLDSRKTADWVRVGFAGLVAAQAMVFGLAANLTPLTGPARLVVHTVLALSALLVFVLLSGPLCCDAWQQARRRQIGWPNGWSRLRCGTSWPEIN